MRSTERSAVVVGAGVGGVAAVGALAAAGVRVTWIDPSFTAGAFANYRDVPANTKVSLLVSHFEALVPQGIHGPARDALAALRQSAQPLSLMHDPEPLGWCGLDAVGDVLSAMSQASFPGVTRIVGTVLCVVGEAGGGWRVSYETEGGRAELRATSVVMSTGCVPVAAPRLGLGLGLGFGFGFGLGLGVS